jgi:PKD repeat protein
MIIQSVIQTYVYNQSGGVVTEPVNGNWLQAYCEYLGVTEPVNASWLQALCLHFGITQPLYGSWTIALANYYGITQPENGTWWYALSQAGGVVPPSVSFIWNENTNNWEAETRIWDTVTVAPTANFTSDITMVPEGGQVQYQDTSISQPASWSWTFEGGTPGTSTDQNPLITYDTIGQYDTSLEASNVIGSNLITKIDYIDTVSADVTITFELRTEWSLYWYYGGMQLEQEVTPGVWQALEYEGNPTWSNGATFYKVQPYVNAGGIPAGYSASNIMTFRSGDESGATDTQPIFRDIICPAGFNYRIVGVTWNTNQDPNYARFNRYTVLNGATVVLPQYDGEDVDWLTGNVQQTFTL